jgi:hypothetical protein
MLTALGLGAGSLFLPSLRRGRGRAHADPAAPPQRLIIVTTGHGCVHENWNMRPEGLTGPDVADWDFPLTTQGLTFSRILAPYAPLASKTLVVEGLAQYPSFEAGGNGHYTGAIVAFTSSMPRNLGADITTASGPSVDQIVAKQIARPDRLPSLELGSYHRAAVFDDDGIELPVEYHPSNVFQRLFGEPVGNTTEGSVLDLVASQYESLASQLGNADRQKLAQHQQLIRDLEKRIASLANLKCDTPAAVTEPDGTQPTGYYKAWVDAFAKCIVAAFSCDVTRVVSLQLEGPSLADIDAPANVQDLHQEYAHHADDCEARTADGIEYMTRYHTYNTEVIASLALALDAVPEGGGTMLDNTLIVTGGELGSGGHSYARLPHVLIGNAGGKFKTGRYLHTGQRFAVPAGGYDRALIGPPHAKLLTSIAQAFGVNTNLVGAPTATILGRAIDLSGTLPGLS